MNSSNKRVFKFLVLVIAFACAGGAFSASSKAPEPGAQKAQHWSVWGGTLGVRWNRDLAGDLGLVLGAASGRQAQLSVNEHELFALRRAGSLEFNVRNNLKLSLLRTSRPPFTIEKIHNKE